MAAVAIAGVIAVVIALAISPAGAPSGRRGPSGSTVLFSDTFSDGRWCNYERVQNRKYSDLACDYNNQSYPLRQDNGAARFEVRPGDSVSGLGGGERSELSQDSASWQAHEGDEWYVQVRLRLADDFKPGRWTILMQFHAGSGSPPLSLQVGRRGALTLHSAGAAGDVNRAAGKENRVLVPAKTFMRMRGQWFDVDLHVRWSNSIDAGGTEVRIDGAEVAPWRTQKTMASDRIYWKGGIYRAPTDTTQIMWMDDLVISVPSARKR
jgi:hypothetical protein